MNAGKRSRNPRAGETAGTAGITLGKPRYSEAEPTPWEDFLLFAPLMLLGVFGAASSFSSVFPVDVDVKAMVVFIAGISVGVTALFVSKYRRAILLATLGAIAAVCLLTWERLSALVSQGAVHTVNSVISIYESKANVDFSPLLVEQWGQMGEEDTRLSTTVFAASLLLLVALVLGWLLVRRRNAFLSFFLTVPFPAASLAYTIVPDFKALMALGLYWLFLYLCVAPHRSRDTFLEKRSRRGGARGIYLDGGRPALRLSSLAVVPILALCILVTAGIFPYEGYERPQISNNLRSGIVSGNIGLSIFRSGGVAGNTNRVDLRHAGNLRHKNETVIRVKSTKSTPDYLKGFVGSVYTGTGWEQLPEASREELAGIEADAMPQNYAAKLFQLFDMDFVPEDAAPYELTVENVNVNPRCVYAPYGLSSTPGALKEIEFVSDGFLRSSNNLFGLREYRLEAVSVPPYSLYFAYPDFDELPQAYVAWLPPELKSFFEDQSRYKAFAYERYTELPEGLKATLNKYLDERGLDLEKYADPLAAYESDTDTANVRWESFPPTDFVLDVVRQVQSENAYTRSPGATPAGRDFVEYFLTENHKGYCVHFATAVAALLRSVGIPARYAEGFVVSPEDPKTKDGWTELPDTRAHAWVEIYMNGAGWVPVEATPGRQSGITIPWQASAVGIPASETPTPIIADSTGAGITSGSAANATAGAATGNTDEDASGAGIIGGADGPTAIYLQTTVLGMGGIFGSPVTWVVVAAIFSLILAARIVRRRRVARRERNFESEDRKEAVLAVYSYIEKLKVFAGGNKRSAASPEALLPQELMDIVMEARFGRREPTQDALDTLIAYADELSARIKRDMPSLRLLCGKYVYGLF
ncbi:MAG: DUF3488 and transglutaminase-like domain-containing protein [Clostridiales Family XIII bacterium]|jgi:hypothetical protein|nr:DUF3488 and transglutaminase-like domain-containing protein [Clostridiales Family XIII bacterium]